MFDLSKPIDINTIIVVVAFIAGGMMFVANTNAQMAAVRQEVRDQGESMKTLTQRIDTLFLTQRQTVRSGE
jgi:sensor domain CHASE-containing protein